MAASSNFSAERYASFNAKINSSSKSHEDGGILDTRHVPHGQLHAWLARFPFPGHPTAHDEPTSNGAQPGKVPAALWARQRSGCSADLPIRIDEELPTFLCVDQYLRDEEVPSFLPLREDVEAEAYAVPDASFAPGFELPPRLPALGPAGIGADDQPGSWVGFRHPITTCCWDERGCYEGRCNG